MPCVLPRALCLFLRLTLIGGLCVGSEARLAAATAQDQAATASPQGGVSSSAQPEQAQASAPPEPLKPARRQELAATLSTQREARTMRLQIPAPRGLIVDRNGVVLAQNRVVSYLALNFPFMDRATAAQIISLAREKMAKANELLGKQWNLPDERLLSHYQNRRWLPLVFSITDGIYQELSNEEQAKLGPLLRSGELLIQPAYIRYYPKGDSSSHLLGWTGRERRLPEGPIADGDPLFEAMEGRQGLEMAFDAQLKGQPGEISLLFDAQGHLLSEETLKRPIPGHTIVTTLDYNLQRHAENALGKHAKNGGAMVIMDIRNGHILAMASNPGFDPNEFVFGIKDQRWQELNNDPRAPLLGRAFGGDYPPASTFKLVTALGALESGRVQADTIFPCPTSLQVGDRVFHNHAKEDEGDMDVIAAIKRSCNTWFYQAALQTGPETITEMATRLGFGLRCDLPIKGEKSGYVPTPADHKILPGETANIAIGQGTLLATPLQVCRSMAAIGDGGSLRQPLLVSQVQTVRDEVLEVFEPKVIRPLNLSSQARGTVVRGMISVVSAPGGTGRAAGISQVQIAGKTGTAQWKPAKDQNLAWFTGFLPASQPVLAYSVLYEGRPGETVSGGGIAAPVVREVFTAYYEGAKPDDPLITALKDLPQAVAVEEEVPSAIPVAPTSLNDSNRSRSLGGFFRRLFRRD